jgi:hypothetical protein
MHSAVPPCEVQQLGSLACALTSWLHELVPHLQCASVGNALLQALDTKQLQRGLQRCEVVQAASHCCIECRLHQGTQMMWQHVEGWINHVTHAIHCETGQPTLMNRECPFP